MIALPGLTLETGRPDLARSILRNAARFLDQGMLPNVFPEARPGSWRVGSIQHSRRHALVFRGLAAVLRRDLGQRAYREIYPKLAEVIDWHARGTRYGIHVDDADGLLRRRRARRATDLDGRQRGRPSHYAAHRQARGSECALVQRAANHVAIHF